MVYESDFYTTRRPYRTTPSYSTYTVSSVPSRQVRVLPGLGKVHIVHTYDRIVPYVGHKRLTVVTTPPKVWSTRPSVLQREYDWIEKKVRPWVAYSATNNYLNSPSSVRLVYLRYPIGTSVTCSCMSPSYVPTYTNYYRIYRPLSYYSDYWPILSTLRYYSDYIPGYNYLPLRYYSPSYRYYRYYLDDLPSTKALKLQSIFDDETRLIRAQSAALLKKIHEPVLRSSRSWPITSVRYGYEDLSSYPFKWSPDSYVHKMMTVSPSNKVEYMTYYTEPVRKWIGPGHLSCVRYAGDYAYDRRHNFYHPFEETVKNDIQLLSYYINKFRQDKSLPPKDTVKVPLSPLRPSRRFNQQKQMEDPQSQEIKELREARAARLAKIYAGDTIAQTPRSTKEEDDAKSKRREEERRKAEERSAAEDKARREAEAKREEAARKAELARQEAERAAELERQAELARQEELAKQAEIERAKKQAEEEARLEEQRRLEEEARAEEERQQLLRLEEIARQAEEEREAELARQAEELAELARQEAELAEEAKKKAEEEEFARQQAELAELERQEAELAELERKEKELQEEAEREAEKARLAEEEAERARIEAEEAELAQQQEELEALRRAQAELDALEAEAKAMASDFGDPAAYEDQTEVVNEDTTAEETKQEDEAPAAAEESSGWPGNDDDDHAEVNAPFSDQEEPEE